ncbi:MAG TPA: hypothetical protein VG271_10325, partial [Beijerinckiaceae bacterium]|nr:hypothetical protein [Beijerinckiaceae bacterium]
LVYLVLSLWSPTKAHLFATCIIAVALAVYWLRFDTSLHAENRYYMRTALLVGTLAFATWSAAQSLTAEGTLRLPIPLLGRGLALLHNAAAARALSGALIVVTLIHAVETTKFVRGWQRYEKAVRALAMGDASDPALGDPRFVSSARIGADLNRLAWFSTTPFLSVLLASDFRPTRLIMDPRDPSVNYFWLSCATATENEEAKRAVPVESRRLVRVFSCQHR